MLMSGFQLQLFHSPLTVGAKCFILGWLRKVNLKLIHSSTCQEHRAWWELRPFIHKNATVQGMGGRSLERRL